MGHITIRTPSNAEEKFEKMLKANLKRLINEKIGQNNLDEFNIESGIKNAISSIRVSIETRNKLKKLLSKGETYEDLIIKIIETNEQLQERLNSLKILEKENKDLIEYMEREFKRNHKTFTWHPDIKIEYSYNDQKIQPSDKFTFNLEIDNYILQGKPVTEREGIKTIQSIKIVKSLKDINITSDVGEIFQKKKQLIDSEEEFIKTKYITYFKILYFIINKKLLSKNLKEENYFQAQTWAELYSRRKLPEESFNEDVIEKLKKFDLELNQIKTNKERHLWNLNRID